MASHLSTCVCNGPPVEILLKQVAARLTDGDLDKLMGMAEDLYSLQGRVVRGIQLNYQSATRACELADSASTNGHRRSKMQINLNATPEQLAAWGKDRKQDPRLRKLLIKRALTDHDPKTLAEVVSWYKLPQKAAERVYEVLGELDPSDFDWWIGQDPGAYSSPEHAIMDVRQFLAELSAAQ